MFISSSVNSWLTNQEVNMFQLRALLLCFGSILILVNAQMKPVHNCTNIPHGCPPNIQTYLTDYGYLNPNMECDNFEDDIRAALIRFQQLNIGFKNLSITGECDERTIDVMGSKRCGCEDIFFGDEKKKMMMRQNQIGPQEYRIGNTMWRKRRLTWRVTKYPNKNRALGEPSIDEAFKRALNIWANVTNLEFVKTSPNDVTADINIRFETRRHTPTEPFFDFDGPGGVLAHAFFPESGLVHFDDDENFVLGSDKGTELYIVAAHEFGHTLGISHSNINSALMAPYYRYSENLQLDSDDIAAVQAIYGRKNTPHIPTPAPPTLPPTTRIPQPSYCSMKVDASYKIDDITYIFTQEKVGQYSRRTFIYPVTRRGIDPGNRIDIANLFISNERSTWRYRPYPYRVDAAAYIPNIAKIFLFSGTRAYRYTKNNSKFILDADFPRWMDVKEFPERPRAAVAMPYPRSSNYYMLIFGSTMVWDWNLSTQKVGAWAYPIEVYGRNMPLRIDSAFLEDSNRVVFIQGKMRHDFSVPYRRILSENDVKPLATHLFKGSCM